jgi:hypothetical protein
MMVQNRCWSRGGWKGAAGAIRASSFRDFDGPLPEFTNP